MPRFGHINHKFDHYSIVKFLNKYLVLLATLIIIVLCSDQAYGQKEMDRKITQSSGKKIVHILHQTRLKLSETLKSLSKQEAICPQNERKCSISLKLVESQIKKINGAVTIYFQREREPQLSTKVALALRDEVWLLLDQRNHLFQRINGRFCLRPKWERLLAKMYVSLKRITPATLHALRAYQCSGREEDLAFAKRIKATSFSREYTSGK
jgi:hypothetical protein